MSDDFLTEAEALGLVHRYLTSEGQVSTTQEILDSGAVPALKGFTVRPGKVSDSIYGGRVEFVGKDGSVAEAENPLLVTRDGRPLRLMVRTQRISTHDINRGEIPLRIRFSRRTTTRCAGWSSPPWGLRSSMCRV